MLRGDGDVERQGAGWVTAFCEGVINGAQPCLTYQGSLPQNAHAV
jgi:hypothetical protein